MKYSIYSLLLYSTFILSSANENDIVSKFHQRLTDFINSTVYTKECGNFRSQVLRLNFSDTAEYFNPCINEIYESVGWLFLIAGL